MKANKSGNQGSWFFHDGELVENQTILMDPAEGRHAVRSMRLGVGDCLVLFNGIGQTAECEILSIGNREAKVEVRTVSVQHHARPAVSITLITAIPKGERQSTMVEMLTQAGADEIIPLHSEFSQVKFSENIGLRWQRIAISACKQSKRAYTPTIHDGLTLSQALQAAKGRGDETVTGKVFGSQSGIQIFNLEKQDFSNVKNMMLFVGPEGGFSDPEVDLLLAEKSTPVMLSPFILRTETASVLLTAAVRQFLSES